MEYSVNFCNRSGASCPNSADFANSVQATRDATPRPAAVWVIAGHGRLMAARKLGMDAVPAIELSHLSPAQRRAYVISDNQLALQGGWSDELLHLELAEPNDLGFDLNLIGFSDGELDRLLNLEPGNDDDEAASYESTIIPEPPRNPVSRRGDLWVQLCIPE